MCGCESVLVSVCVCTAESACTQEEEWGTCDFYLQAVAFKSPQKRELCCSPLRSLLTPDIECESGRHELEEALLARFGRGYTFDDIIDQSQPGGATKQRGDGASKRGSWIHIPDRGPNSLGNGSRPAGLEDAYAHTTGEMSSPLVLTLQGGKKVVVTVGA